MFSSFLLCAFWIYFPAFVRFTLSFSRLSFRFSNSNTTAENNLPNEFNKQFIQYTVLSQTFSYAFKRKANHYHIPIRSTSHSHFHAKYTIKHFAVCVFDVIMVASCAHGLWCISSVSSTFFCSKIHQSHVHILVMLNFKNQLFSHRHNETSWYIQTDRGKQIWYAN